jgi:hypothetical protein
MQLVRLISPKRPTVGNTITPPNSLPTLSGTSTLKRGQSGRKGRVSTITAQNLSDVFKGATDSPTIVSSGADHTDSDEKRTGK